jgi:hypothetical protein
MGNLKKLISPLLIIFIAVILRLIPHPPNMAPIAAMALFGGAYLNKKYALIMPIIAMIISDYFLGFHNLILFVYGSFFLIGVVGLILRNKINPKNIFFASIFSSIAFFLITNFGVWLVFNFYPKTSLGLLNCYIAAIPFFRNSVLGDLLYNGIFFGGYELTLRLIFRKKLLIIK